MSSLFCAMFGAQGLLGRCSASSAPISFLSIDTSLGNLGTPSVSSLVSKWLCFSLPQFLPLQKEMGMKRVRIHHKQITLLPCSSESPTYRMGED